MTTATNGHVSTADFDYTHSHTNSDFPHMTPEKLAIMKLNSSELQDDVFSDPGTVQGGRKSLGFSRAEGVSRSLTRSSRQISSSNRRQSSFIHSHRNKMSMELSTQAESKFFSLIELMSSASREASSLKEYWQKLMSDRESFDREREELLLQIDEITETLERKESQHHHHGRELDSRKKDVERLLVDLSTALNTISVEKKRVAERDQELERSRNELSDIRLSGSRLQVDFDKVKSDIDSTLARLRACEGERDHAREDGEKYRSELRILTREYTETKSKNSDLLAKLDYSRKEVSNLTDRIKGLERDRDIHLTEKDRLHEEIRKNTVRSEETARELSDLTTRYDHLLRESRQLKESIRFVEVERDEHVTTIDRLRHEIKTKTTGVEEVETRLAEIILKFEQSKRDVISKDDRLRDLESEIQDLHLRVERSTEEHRIIIIERDQLKDDVENERHKHTDNHRHHTTLQESLTRTEGTLAEVRADFANVTERIKIIERERDEHRDKHNHLHHDHSHLKEKLALLQAEIRTLTDARDRHRKEVEDYRRRYEEVTETITEYKDDSGELEWEIDSLRTMLREAREQKERAVSARAAADRERDEYMAKYEEKCREMERWEESRSSYFHSHGHGNSGQRTSSTRVVTRNGGSSSFRGGESSSFQKHETVDGE